MSNNTKIIHLDFTAPESGERYQGQFIIKRFAVKDHSKISVIKTRLNGGLHSLENGQGIDIDTDNFNYMLAVVEVGIVDAPKWFSLDEVYDFSLVRHLHQEVAEFQSTFRADRRAGAQSSGASSSVQTGSGQKAQITNGSGKAPAVVEHEVQYSLEP